MQAVQTEAPSKDEYFPAEHDEQTLARLPPVPPK